MSKKLNTVPKDSIIFFSGIIPYKAHAALFLSILVKCCEMALTMSKQEKQQEVKKSLGEKAK